MYKWMMVRSPTNTAFTVCLEIFYNLIFYITLFLARMVTLAPSLADPIATAFPIPLDPPVT